MVALSLGILSPTPFARGRDYDDGGLADLNTAPARTIAALCGITV